EQVAVNPANPNIALSIAKGLPQEMVGGWLATKPDAIGSLSRSPATIGMLFVAARTARTAAGLIAKIKFTLRATSSAASGVSKAGSPLATRVRSICRSAQPMSLMGLVSRVTPVHTAMRNCTRDEGRSFEVGNQVLISSHRKLLSSKAMVVNGAEKSEQDFDRHD